MKFPWIIARRRRLEILEDQLFRARETVKSLDKMLGKTQDWLANEQRLGAEQRRVIEFYRGGQR